MCSPPGMRKHNGAFLTYFQTDYATATLRMTFKNQHTAYFSLRALMTHADEPQDLWVTGPKFTKFVAVAICFVDGANTTIRIAIRPSIVE